MTQRIVLVFEAEGSELVSVLVLQGWIAPSMLRFKE